jgi:hypothetical protein
MRVNVAIPESQVSAPVLNAALESVTRLNEAMLADHEVPTFTEGLKSGVRWKPEPPGAEHFDHAGVVLGRKWGDCDDLAPWQAASLRHTGEDPGARAVVKRSGPKRWHAVVKLSDGTIDDPSRAAGMGQNREGVVGASLPLMYTAPSAVVGGAYRVRPALAMRPFRDRIQARADLPWHWKAHESDKMTPTDYAMAALHSDPVASTALVGAIDGALRLGIAGGYAHPEHIKRLNAIAEAIEGEDVRDIAARYGEQHAIAACEVVGSFFGKLAKGAGSLVKMVPGAGAALKLATGPLGKKLIQFIPGVGPIASSALELAPGALSMLKKGKGAAPARAAQGAAPARAAQPVQSAIVKPMNPFPSVEAYARQGRLCIPATWE